MSEAQWTEERVRAAYSEWRALSEHVQEVGEAMDRARGYPVGDYYGLRLPEWSGSGWPGERCLFRYEDENRSELPLEWLWTYPRCVEEAKAVQTAWMQTREAQEQEEAERREFERLKAKFEKVPR